MAIGHAVRGAASAALALIVLEAIGADHTGKVGGFFADVSRLLARAISPDVPLIPDRRAGAGADASQLGYITPQQAAAAAKVARNLPAVDAVGAFAGGPSLAQYVAGGGLPALAVTSNPAFHPAG